MMRLGGVLPSQVRRNFQKVFNHHPHNNYAHIFYHNGKKLVRTARTIEQFTNSK
jgi:hypothetical protein